MISYLYCVALSRRRHQLMLIVGHELETGDATLMHIVKPLDLLARDGIVQTHVSIVSAHC